MTGKRPDFRLKYDTMKTERKKSLLAHSCAAISIGLMAWVAGTVAISIFQMMEKARATEKQQEQA